MVGSKEKQAKARVEVGCGNHRGSLLHTRTLPSLPPSSLAQLVGQVKLERTWVVGTSVDVQWLDDEEEEEEEGKEEGREEGCLCSCSSSYSTHGSGGGHHAACFLSPVFMCVCRGVGWW